MRWLQTVLHRGKEGEPVVITAETTLPTEEQRRLIAEVIKKLTDDSQLWRWRPVYNWTKAFDAVKKPGHGLTAEEKYWMLNEFEPEMDRCERESRRSEGYFHHPTILLYPEGYVAVRAGGFEVPILAPAEFKWGSRLRGNRVAVVDQLPGFFEEKPIISPNNNLSGHMKTMLEENMTYLNKVFGYVYSELGLLVVQEGEFSLRLGRKRPGVFIHVLPQLDTVTVIQI